MRIYSNTLSPAVPARAREIARAHARRRGAGRVRWHLARALIFVSSLSQQVNPADTHLSWSTSRRMPRRYICYGVGGVGGVICAKLAQSGLDVVAIARGEHLSVIQAKGLRLRTPAEDVTLAINAICLLYTSPSPRDGLLSRMPSSA